jgi:hypothetical protein
MHTEGSGKILSGSAAAMAARSRLHVGGPPESPKRIYCRSASSVATHSRLALLRVTPQTGALGGRRIRRSFYSIAPPRFESALARLVQASHSPGSCRFRLFPSAAITWLTALSSATRTRALSDSPDSLTASGDQQYSLGSPVLTSPRGFLLRPGIRESRNQHFSSAW